MKDDSPAHENKSVHRRIDMIYVYMRYIWEMRKHLWSFVSGFTCLVPSLPDESTWQ